jgi:chemotaxis signal transduction protein
MSESNRCSPGDQNALKAEAQERQSRLISEIEALETHLIALRQELVQDRSRAEGLCDSKRKLSLALFVISQRLVALPLRNIEQVELMPAIAEVVQEGRGVVGVVNYHGDHLVVVDLASLLRLQEKEVSADRVLVICKVTPFRFALMVDEAVDVVTVNEKEVRIAEDVLIAQSRAWGLLRWKAQSVAILDPLSLAVSTQGLKPGRADSGFDQGPV